MYRINKSKSSKLVTRALVLLAKVDNKLKKLLRKVNTNLLTKNYLEIPATSEELLAMYNGKEDITNIDASVLLGALVFEEVEVETEQEIVHTPIDMDYADMTVEELTATLFNDLDKEATTSIVAMTTGLKVKLDLLDELKATVRDSFPNIRSELLTAKLANALALVKSVKGSALNTGKDGNLTVYKYLNSKDKIACDNFVFMADFESEDTNTLPILILEATFKSYKETVNLGLLPIPSSELVIAVTRAIKGITAVTEDNMNEVSSMTFE